MNKQQEVIQAIRKQLPRLMELDKGCVLEYNFKNHKKNVTAEIVKVSKDIITIITDLTDGTLEVVKEVVLGENYKIRGKEPTILDALECLNLQDEFLGVGFDGEILEWIDGREYRILNDKLTFDLSNLNIADQSEKTINFLHSVLCKEK